jgi:hypothetical protein
MGAFDKDKEIGLRADIVLGLRAPFVLFAVETDGELIETKYGDAQRVFMGVATLGPNNQPGSGLWVNTIASAVVEKLADIEPDELPAICLLARVPVTREDGRTIDALTIQYVSEYHGQAVDLPPRRRSLTPRG